MKKTFLYFMLMAAIVSCKSGAYDAKVHFPSKQYEYVYLGTSKITESGMVYVPVYSHIYMQNGTRVTNLAATLSIRSMSFSDTIFISKVDYYSSEGKLLKKYLDSTLVLKPMHSLEFVVEEQENEGGAGANFMVEWRSLKSVADPLIQAVMIGTYNNLGISFNTDGVKLSKVP